MAGGKWLGRRSNWLTLGVGHEAGDLSHAHKSEPGASISSGMT